MLTKRIIPSRALAAITGYAMVGDDEDLIKKYVTEDVRWPGAAEARITGYGVPVWALIGYLRAVDGDINRVAHDYDLPDEAVRAAEAYYRQNRDTIDARLIENAPTP